MGLRGGFSYTQTIPMVIYGLNQTSVIPKQRFIVGNDQGRTYKALALRSQGNSIENNREIIPMV